MIVVMGMVSPEAPRTEQAMTNKKLAGIIVACTVAIVVAIVLFGIKPSCVTPPSELHTLTTVVNPPGAGSVYPSGGEYDSGVHVTLTAVPEAGYTFVNWSGAASGSSNVVTVTMTSDKAITAHFGRDGDDEGSDQLPPGAIAWHEAKDHFGDRVTVCGLVVDAYYASGTNGKPTFLNLGNPHPNRNRFTVVIWGRYRSNFPQAPESYYLGKTICVTGLIIDYGGIPEIEIRSPSEIEVQGQ